MEGVGRCCGEPQLGVVEKQNASGPVAERNSGVDPALQGRFDGGEYTPGFGKRDGKLRVKESGNAQMSAGFTELHAGLLQVRGQVARPRPGPGVVAYCCQHHGVHGQCGPARLKLGEQGEQTGHRVELGGGGGG